MNLSARFEEAMRYALAAHRHQVRKGTTIPYAAHLLGVASLVLEHGADEEVAVAALLHDCLEDLASAGEGSAGEARDAIRRRFGLRVAAIVEGCTDAAGKPKPPWRPRKEAHLARLREATPEVLLVTAADKLHNARAILEDYRAEGETLWHRFRGGRQGTLWYYRQAADLLGQAPGAPPRLTAMLRRTVEEICRMAGEGERT